MANFNVKEIIESSISDATSIIERNLQEAIGTVVRDLVSTREELRLVVRSLDNALSKIDSEWGVGTVNDAYEMIRDSIYDIENQIDNLEDVINSMS